MKKKNWIYTAVFTVIFAICSVGLEYAYMLGTDWINWMLAFFLALCMFGAAQINLVGGIVVALCGAIAGAQFLMDYYSTQFAVILAVANIILVVCYWAFPKKRLLGVAVASAARFAFLYLVAELLMPGISADGQFDTVLSTLSYLLMPLAAGAVFYLVALLMNPKKKQSQAQAPDPQQ